MKIKTPKFTIDEAQEIVESDGITLKKVSKGWLFEYDGNTDHYTNKQLIEHAEYLWEGLSEEEKKDWLEDREEN